MYSLTVAPAKGDTSVRVIGAQLDYLLTPEQPAEALALLTDPGLRIVTRTITGGGYHVGPDSGVSSPTIRTSRTTCPATVIRDGVGLCYPGVGAATFGGDETVRCGVV